MMDEYTRLMNYRQLFLPPPRSLQILESTSKDKPSLSYPDEELSATQIPRNFVRHILREQYLPPPETPFVPFSSEEGAYDVVRARYVAGSREVDIAATICVLSITVSSQEAGTTTCTEHVTRLAQQMLVTTRPLQLVQVGQEGEMSFGKQGRAPVTEYPFWEDALRWWCTPTRIGFVTLATLGGPKRLDYKFSPEFNRVWFRFHKRTKPPRPKQW